MMSRRQANPSYTNNAFFVQSFSNLRKVLHIDASSMCTFVDINHKLELTPGFEMRGPLGNAGDAMWICQSTVKMGVVPVDMLKHC